MYNLIVFTRVAWSMAAIFGLAGLLHLAAPGFLRRAYERWNFPPGFTRVAGVIELLAAAFLAAPITRLWGVALAAFIAFVTIVKLLENRQYAWSLPATLVLVALVPASLSATF